MTAAEGTRRLGFDTRFAGAGAAFGDLRVHLVLLPGASPQREFPLG
jgi:hypothetical protein